MKQLTKLFTVALMALCLQAHAQKYNDPSIDYEGSWKLAEACQCAYSNQPGDQLAYEFTTNEPATLHVIGERMETHGIARIEVDGQPHAVDQFSETTQAPDTLLSVPMQPGSHAVKVIVTGDKHPQASNNYVAFRAFSVETTNQRNPGKEVDITPTVLQSWLSGKKYFSIISDDTIYVYTKQNDSIDVVAKYSYEAKLMADLRVVNRNINTLEIYMFVIASLLIVLLALFFLRR